MVSCRETFSPAQLLTQIQILVIKRATNINREQGKGKTNEVLTSAAWYLRWVIKEWKIIHWLFEALGTFLPPQNEEHNRRVIVWPLNVNSIKDYMSHQLQHLSAKEEPRYKISKLTLSNSLSKIEIIKCFTRSKNKYNHTI